MGSLLGLGIMTDRKYILSEQLGAALKKRSLKLSVAESCTGGGLAFAITAVPGSSDWFDCGFVTYSNESKENLLGVPPELLRLHGAVSQPVAEAMSKGALQHSRADISLSITGVAGPGGGTKRTPVGTVWISIATQKGHCESHRILLKGDRDEIRRSTILYALERLLEIAS